MNKIQVEKLLGGAASFEAEFLGRPLFLRTSESDVLCVNFNTDLEAPAFLPHQITASCPSAIHFFESSFGYTIIEWKLDNAKLFMALLHHNDLRHCFKTTDTIVVVWYGSKTMHDCQDFACTGSQAHQSLSLAFRPQ